MKTKRFIKIFGKIIFDTYVSTDDLKPQRVAMRFKLFGGMAEIARKLNAVKTDLFYFFYYFKKILPALHMVADRIKLYSKFHKFSSCK